MEFDFSLDVKQIKNIKKNNNQRIQKIVGNNYLTLLEIEILFCGELCIKYQYLVMTMIKKSCFFGENLRNRIPDIDKTFSRKKIFSRENEIFFPR